MKIYRSFLALLVPLVAFSVSTARAEEAVKADILSPKLELLF